MIDETKVQRMTKLAIFEKKHEKEIETVRSTYRSDYVSAKMMKNWIFITIAFDIGFVVWALYRLDEIAASLNKLDPVQFGLQILTVYLVVMGIYMILTWVVYTIRYQKMKKARERYRKMMQPLAAEYEKTEKRRTKE